MSNEIMTANRENIIKGLEEISDYFFAIYRKDTDSYTCAKAQGYSDAAIDAIALLKEQEPVEPIRDAICVRMFRCGACGAYVGFIDSDPGDTNEQDNYCRNCGRAVKWDA